MTLRLVARYADACNQTGALEEVARREAILREHCEAVGRDHREIERSACPPVIVIRDSRAEARDDYESLIRRLGPGRRPLSEPKARFDGPAPQPVGTADDVTALLQRYVDLGYTHLIFSLPPPYDEETMIRLAHEVRPRLKTAPAKKEA